LSPASVLVTYDGRVKVSGDLGCSSREVTAGPLDGLAARLAYLAPECCSGGRGDMRCDVYALGAILWEALAGRPRSHGLTPERAVMPRLRGEEADLESVCPDVLPALAAVTRRALSTDPADRHPSVGALREDLETIARLDVFRNETTQLLGFMCNHFCEEYAALQALLEERSMLHALFEKRPTLHTGSHALLQTDARTWSQAPLDERAERLSRPSIAPEPGGHLSLLESGLRRVPELGVQPSTTGPLGISLVIPNLPLAQTPRMAPPRARAFGQAETAVVVIGVFGALAALGWSGSGTRAAGPFDVAAPATVVVPGASSLDPLPADPASAPSVAQSPRAAAEARAVNPARPPPERVSGKRLRPVRSNSKSRATRTDSRLEAATGTSARATRRAATSSELDAESSERAGADLRLLKERPQRAIDKQDPYSP
jgi:hypothetical protein